VLSLGVYYLIEELNILKEDALKLQEQIFEFEDSRNNLNQLRRFVDDTKSDRGKIDSYFIKDETEIVELLDDLELLAEILDIKINTTIVVEGTDLTRYGGEDSKDILKLNITVQGAFSNIYNFIDLLENMNLRLAFDFARLNKISSSNTNENSATWSSSLQITILSYKN
jgi:hypothetical protein